MLLEQITTDYEDDDNQQPAPKGMVRTEMGRLVKKADQDARDKKVVKSMNQEYFSRGKKLASMKKKEVKEDVPRKRGLIFDKESFEKLPSMDDKMKADKMKERKDITEQLKKYNDTSVMKSNKKY